MTTTQPITLTQVPPSASYRDSPCFPSFLTPFVPPSTNLFFPADSSLSTTSIVTSAFPSETISERILALRDMVSPSTRRRISSTTSQLTNLVKGGALWGGKGLWVLTASALMVGVPWAMAFVEEQQIMEMEREQRARESTGEVRFSRFLHFLAADVFDVQRGAGVINANQITTV